METHLFLDPVAGNRSKFSLGNLSCYFLYVLIKILRFIYKRTSADFGRRREINRTRAKLSSTSS